MALPVVVVDSESTDDSAAFAQECKFKVLTIRVADFNHGRTRQWATDQLAPGTDIVIFLTHDAIVESDASISCLLEGLSDPSVGAAYGRQLPHADTGPIGAHARLYNYPGHSEVRSQQDIPRLGIKAAFLSNSFAAYRISALRAVGGFPDNYIFGEDTVVAVRMLRAGYKVAYCADATVRHSHDYSVAEEFMRYFDIGVLHTQADELVQLPSPNREGARFALSEIRYLMRNAPHLLPGSLVRTAAKYSGYKVGRLHKHLSVATCRRLSMTKGYWSRAAGK